MVKCVYNETTYVGNNFSKSDLIGETRQGKRVQLLPIGNDGIRAALKVTTNGFTLKNVHNEILREGTATDVFEIVDSILFSVDPLEVKTENFSGSFKEFERNYGIDRVERDEQCRFKAYYVRTAGGIGLGLTEYRRLKTTAIYSIFVPEPMSDKEINNYIA